MKFVLVVAHKNSKNLYKFISQLSEIHTDYQKISKNSPFMANLSLNFIGRVNYKYLTVCKNLEIKNVFFKIEGFF